MSGFESSDLSKAAAFSKIPFLKEFVYRGRQNLKISVFDVQADGAPARLFLSTLIAADEGAVWKSCQDLLERTVKTVALSIKGFFGFDLLALDFAQGVQGFNWGMLSQLIVNHCRKMQPGENRIIQYGSLYGNLHKRIHEEWGKIEFKSCVEVYTQPQEKLDLYLKKLLREAAAGRDEKKDLFLINDLGQMPIFRFGQQEQTERLRKLLESIDEQEKQKIAGIYIVHRTQTIEIFEQFNMKIIREDE